MKHLLTLLFVFCLTACGTTVTSLSSSTYGTQMKNVFERNFSKQQFDSICNADKITNDLSKWISSPIRDIETGKPIIQYLFINKTNNSEDIYRVQQNGDSLWISKRVTK